MRISKIKIRNYRLLKAFEFDVEKDLSLVIGKNNCGKTSLLSALKKFFNAKPNTRDFSCDDFNIDFQKELKAKIESTDGYDKSFCTGVSLKLFIEYEERDDLSNVSKLLMDLSPDNTTIVLSFTYTLSESRFFEFRKEYHAYKDATKADIRKRYAAMRKKASKEEKARLDLEEEYKMKMIFYDFLKMNIHFFIFSRRTILFDVKSGCENDEEYIDIDTEGINLDKILNFKVISARRDVSNKDSNKALSLLSSDYYAIKENQEQNSPPIQKFKQALSDTDSLLDGVYKGLFKSIVDKVEKFGGIKKGDSVIKIVSTLQHKELLKGNTTVMYDHQEEHSLPEHYNGLGYMNLIGIIFEIEVLLTDFRREYSTTERPADLNLLFIEEPEAHTHPQMQYIFIKNIKDILKTASRGEGGTPAFTLQTIITTHSSHIAAEGQFHDIKYFTRINTNEVIAKNLSDLEKEYASEREHFKFLKQYLTLNRAELFFADKAIFIEGDTERILLPAMMKKIDQDEPDNALLSQHISIVEVGAYSKIFEKFIDFIGTKSLIISDIDAAAHDYTARKTDATDAVTTTNASLKFFHNGENKLSYYKDLPISRKQLKKNAGSWQQDVAGRLLLVFQSKEKNSAGKEYHASSFEDSFFHLNRQFIIDSINEFESLKHKDYFKDAGKDPYDLAEQCISKKPSFAMEILLNSKTIGEKQFANWEIPAYIKEGLQWLKQN